MIAAPFQKVDLTQGQQLLSRGSQGHEIRMILQNHAETTTPTGLSESTSAAYTAFHAKGWTIRTAAERLGVSRSHLHKVLTGQRKNRRILECVAALPIRGRVPKRQQINRRKSMTGRRRISAPTYYITPA